MEVNVGAHDVYVGTMVAIAEMIEALVVALQNAPTFAPEVVLVDDGSTDGTADAAAAACDNRVPLRIISQSNQGRFLARKNGVEAAGGDWTLLLDTRIRLRPDALVFISKRLDLGDHVWNGHVEVDTEGNPIPSGTSRCNFRYSTLNLPWPVLNADGSPAPVPQITCGSQRPPVNTAPAIGPDGTIFDISRAALDDYYGYVVAINPNLTPKWAASMREKFTDGCGTATLPPNGAPNGCSAGLSAAFTGVSPPTGRAGDGRVLDDSTSAVVVAPDGSVFYGAYTRYNYAQGHLMHWTNAGQYIPANNIPTNDPATSGFQFGWDITPGIYPYVNSAGASTYAVILKENHYGDVGSYCNDKKICPPDRTATNPGYPEQYFISSLNPDLTIRWRFQNTNTNSCSYDNKGNLTCTSDHPFGFEWCVNAPGIDSNGNVFANSEDGNLYELDANGHNFNTVFTNLAIGAAYTPLSIGPDGRIYTQNDGIMFVIGN